MRTAPSVRARADRGWAAALAAGGINLLLFGALAWVNRPAAGRPEREEEWTFREVVLFAPELREERPPAERTIGMAMPQPRPAPAPLEAAVAAETFAPRLPDAGPAAVPIPEVPAPPPAAAA
ncbi:MAG TPA: hypothetical protein VNO22_17060, partial [Planctomycetota bacterium]|nr:hypothetical protein [Planctomycetota bacterium]